MSEDKSPAELRAERFDDLRDRWSDLRGRIDLTHLHDEIEDTAGRVEALSDRLADLRRRGYRYRRDWEEEVERL
ncbi:MAG TPA: hypothetical protein ENJ31_06755, partial [Anaerolineae bacterium]|nr:hypothetical protein [Anaerolineae bacterium]